MAQTIPTTQELTDQALASLEGALGQTIPVQDRAFLRVLVVTLAMLGTGIYKVLDERVKQPLALTASGADLDAIGAEFSTPRKTAEVARLTATLPAVTDTIVPVTSTYIGTANGLRYYQTAPVLATAGVATLSLVAEVSGVAGNLQVGDTLSIVSPVAGAEAIATVTVIDNTGAEGETDVAYRPRVLFAERAVTGGNNATDYRLWAEAVAGVLRAYPFAGKPSGASDPGDRTVFIECTTDLDPDGVPGAPLLAEVRAALNIDPVTGAARGALGLPDATLYVEAITRTAVDVTITGLVTPSGTEAAVKTDISAALSLYLRGLRSYVEGVDQPQDRNDRVTEVSVADAIQGVLTATGSAAESVALMVSATPYTTYQLDMGELAKLGTVTYAV